jgi:hypothetical protein
MTCWALQRQPTPHPEQNTSLILRNRTPVAIVVNFNSRQLLSMAISFILGFIDEIYCSISCKRFLNSTADNANFNDIFSLAKFITNCI